jgi:hypothetical protein
MTFSYASSTGRSVLTLRRLAGLTIRLRRRAVAQQHPIVWLSHVPGLPLALLLWSQPCDPFDSVEHE